MHLHRYLDLNVGKLARICTKYGTGFIFAGVITPETELEIRSIMRKSPARIPVLDVSPSFYGGEIVRIQGHESGKEWIPREMETKTLEDIPIEHYQALADTIAKQCAESLKQSIIVSRTAPKAATRQAADCEARQCVQFFLSDQFAVIMPQADGADIVRLIYKRVNQICPPHKVDNSRD